MPRVDTFAADERKSLEAVVGSAWGPLWGLVICGAALAILWRLWAADLRLDDDAYEVASLGIIVLVLGFGAVSAAFALLRAIFGRRLRRTARLVLSTTPRVGEQLQSVLHLSWPLRRDQSVVALLECSVVTESPEGGWNSAPAFKWWWERVVDPPVSAVHTDVPLCFPIPGDAPPSGRYQIAGEGDRRVSWELTASLEPSGPRLHFVVPVSPSPGGLKQVSDELTSEALADSDDRPAGSHITPRAIGGGRTHYTFGRHSSMQWLAWWVTLSAPAWLGLPWLAWRHGEDLPWSILVMLMIAAVINGLPFLFLMQPRTLWITPDGIWFRRQLLRPRRWDVRDMRGTAVQPMLPGRRPLMVFLQPTSDKPLPICHCRSVAEARWLARDVERALAAAREQRSAGHS